MTKGVLVFSIVFMLSMCHVEALLLKAFKALFNPAAEAGQWVVNPPGLQKVDYCEKRGVHVLGGLANLNAKGNRQSFFRAFNIGVRHVRVQFQLRVYAMGSTDGCGQGDYFRIYVDNSPVLADCSMASIRGPKICHQQRMSQAKKKMVSSGTGDVIRNFDFSIAHSAPLLNFVFSSECNQRLGDEAYGFDQLTISVYGCPLTCTSCADENNCGACHPTAVLRNRGGVNICQCPRGTQVTGKYPLTCAPVTCGPTCLGCKANNVCAACPANSQLSDPNQCVCSNGFETHSAQPLSCRSCEVGTVLQSGKCVRIKCDPGSKLEAGTCVKVVCPANCNKCNDDEKCTECAEGYEVRAGNCVEKLCSERCSDCQKGACKACKNGFELQGHDCAQINCAQNCAECTGNGDGKCTSCKQKFELTSGNCVEIKCEANCLRCKGNGAGKCTECADKFELTDGNCPEIKCEENCEQCTGNGKGKCKKCSKGYEFKGSDCVEIICDGACKTCEGSKANQCKSCAENAELLSVVDGISCNCQKGTYVSSKVPLTCGKCHENCAQCLGPLDTNCIACGENQVVKDGRCECAPLFYAKTKAPLLCAKLESCHGACLKCDGPGQFDCLTCPPSADLVKKPEGNTCQCRGGYYEESKVPLKCKKIPCHYSCKLCTGPEENKCLECWTNAAFVDAEDGGKKCDCPPPNVLWETSPNYICNVQYVRYQDVE